MEGRAFSDEEYANGDDVCLVSAAFAEMNGINVGDTVEIDCYDCGIEKLPTIGRIPQRRLTIMPSENIGMRKEYTVIGIYTAPEFEEGLYNFTADTIFAPKKSVPDAEKYENPEVSYLNATVIKNGQVEEFEKYMAEHGMGGYYRYFDMGFESAAPLEAPVANATAGDRDSDVAARARGSGGDISYVHENETGHTLGETCRSEARHGVVRYFGRIFRGDRDIRCAWGIARRAAFTGT